MLLCHSLSTGHRGNKEPTSWMQLVFRNAGNFGPVEDFNPPVINWTEEPSGPDMTGEDFLYLITDLGLNQHALNLTRYYNDHKPLTCEIVIAR